MSRIEDVFSQEKAVSLHDAEFNRTLGRDLALLVLKLEAALPDDEGAG